MPILITVIGLPGVGKSFVGKTIAKKINAVFTEEDKIKHELVPKLIGRKKYEWHVKFQRVFPSEIRRKVYEKVFDEIKNHLESGKNVVLEGTFYSENFRDNLRNFAESCGIKLYVVQIVCPENIIKIRMSERFEKEGGPARFGIYKTIKKLWNPIKEKHFTIDSSKNIDEQVEKFLKQFTTGT